MARGLAFSLITDEKLEKIERYQPCNSCPFFGSTVSSVAINTVTSFKDSADLSNLPASHVPDFNHLSNDALVG